MNISSRRKFSCSFPMSFWLPSQKEKKKNKSSIMWYVYSNIGSLSRVFSPRPCLPTLSFYNCLEYLSNPLRSFWILSVRKLGPVFPHSFIARCHTDSQKSHLEAERSFGFLWNLKKKRKLYFFTVTFAVCLNCSGRITRTSVCLSVCLFFMEDLEKHLHLQ